MAISTNSIIHYTDTIDKLEAILKEGLGIKYCDETLVMEKDTKSLAAHPMISFCDIPLSHSYKHFDAYGRYGIGLSKIWARKYGINPVLYLDKDSSISKTLAEFIKERREKSTNLNEKQKANILRIKCFSKNYSGHLKRKLVDDKNYRFYDEREWRLVPNNDELNRASFSISSTDYNKDKDRYNNPISSIRYQFDASDISYIIVDKTNQIPNVINTVRTAYSSKCTAQELDILFSKICSTEQIIGDY
jgi:hypothetical protein